MTDETQTVLDSSNMFNELANDKFQALLLDGVSRTFALTIPQLPKNLCDVVANAYLLCRIIDTIEDEVSLSAKQKKYFCSAFIDVVKTNKNSETFTAELAPLLSTQTIPAEHQLIQMVPRVVCITHSFEAIQIEAVAQCVETMANGMPVFQAQNLQDGLETLADMNQYCYYVAGCVGEMLAKLFCYYSLDIALHKNELLKLSVSFGQGLQMVNILKDIWDDAQRGVCWLPQDIFIQNGFDLKNLTLQTNDVAFYKGLMQLIAIAQAHLQNALRYTLLIPSHETGIRKFCLWALGMAVLTLRKIKNLARFNCIEQAKISRKSVRAVMVVINLTVRSDFLLTTLFNLSSRELTLPDWTDKRKHTMIFKDDHHV